MSSAQISFDKIVQNNKSVFFLLKMKKITALICIIIRNENSEIIRKKVII